MSWQLSPHVGKWPPAAWGTLLLPRATLPLMAAVMETGFGVQGCFADAVTLCGVMQLSTGKVEGG